MASFAFDSHWQRWLLFIYVFICLYFAVGARLHELSRKMNSRAPAGDNAVCLINFTLQLPRGPTITADPHYILAPREICFSSIRLALTQWRQEDLFDSYWWNCCVYLALQCLRIRSRAELYSTQATADSPVCTALGKCLCWGASRGPLPPSVRSVSHHVSPCTLHTVMCARLLWLLISMLWWVFFKQ